MCGDEAKFLAPVSPTVIFFLHLYSETEDTAPKVVVSPPHRSFFFFHFKSLSLLSLSPWCMLFNQQQELCRRGKAVHVWKRHVQVVSFGLKGEN